MCDDNNKCFQRSRLIHFFYIIGILISIIIILITTEFNDPDIVSYVSFAATLASLILAVLAIVQAMMSSDSYQRSTERLSLVTENISNKSSNLSEATKDLTQSVKTVKKLHATMKSLHTDVKLLANNTANQLNEKITTETGLPVVTKSDENFLEFFFQRTSVSGLTLLYSVKEAFNKSISFKLRGLVSCIELTDYEYAYGYLVAMASVRLIDYEFENDTIKVLSVNEDLLNHLENYLYKRVADFDKEVTFPERNLARNTLEKVDNFFKEEDFGSKSEEIESLESVSTVDES